ncbi:hypothetical protein B0H17DRAFT_1137496 [Mycena rosella]|uniref:Uncharacterized protein n=1 Tax=Mycena rosella TaxID=1033263 RepID=A0AAD7GAU4_MYCRO|nr:hypothetical protein B0H17DRAFT_1137496 [Mycena rosella]
MARSLMAVMLIFHVSLRTLQQSTSPPANLPPPSLSLLVSGSSASLLVNIRSKCSEVVEKDAKTLEKARVETERLVLVGIECDHNKITAMKDKQLQDQLELHRRRGDKEVPIKARFKNKREHLAGLLVILDRLDASIPVQMMS